MKLSGDATATFELFNLWARRPDWVLEVAAPARLRITGTVVTPALPGPSDLLVAYIDEPRGYIYKPITSQLRVLRIGVARVRVEGSVRVEDLAIDIEIEAALVT